jgi:uncharacterized protein
MAAPTAPGERIVLLDVLRGFAIFGILVYNMAFFSAPLYLQMTGQSSGEGAVDRLVELSVRFLVQGKFYSLFSFLFGLGFALQLQRAEARGARFAPLYVRRLLALLLIGLLHGFLIWMGDILTVYALLGFLLFLFRRRQPKTLLVWAALLMSVPVVFMAGMVQASEYLGPSPFGTIEEYQNLVALSHQAYGAGSLADIMAMRARDFLVVTMGGLFFGGGGIVGMFLLGAYFARQRIFEDTGNRLDFFRRLCWWGLALGVAGNLTFTVATELGPPASLSLLGLVGTVGFVVGAPALCFFYLSSIVLLWQSPGWQKHLARLGAVGRMALSNYLFQSVVCTLIFYNYGLGLYGQIGPATGLGLTLLIYTLQVPLSRWWLGRFRFGPAEWLWRSITYGKFQAFRVQAVVAPQSPQPS